MIFFEANNGCGLASRIGCRLWNTWKKKIFKIPISLFNSEDMGTVTC